jgi:hypothetical protein
MEQHVEFHHKEDSRTRREEKEQKASMQSRRGEEATEEVDGPVYKARLEALSEEFVAESEALGRRLQDAGRKIRCENLGKPKGSRQEQEDREKREEEQREKELELRRARKREAMARDPHRKIDIRLENKRRFGDTAGDAAIPMQQIEFVGSNGSDRVQMVDVTVLRARCQLLQNGTTVDSLLQAQKQADKQKRLLQLSRSLASQVKAQELELERCATAPELGMPRKASIASASQLFRPMTGLVGDDRLRMAHARKQARTHDMFVHRLNLMRTEIPETATERFGMIEQSTRHSHPSTAGQDVDSLSNLSSLSTSPRSPDKRGSLARNASGQTPEHKSTRRKHKLANRQDIDKSIVAHERAQAHWRKAQGAYFLIWLLARVRKQNEAHRKITTFLGRLGEWTRIKSTAAQLVKALKKVQKTFREYIIRKHAHIALLEQQWQTCEDEFLSAYFSLYFRKLFEERPDSPTNKASGTTGKSKEKEKQEMMHNGHWMDDISHWVKFRIPALDRYQVLDQYYRSQLRRRSKVVTSLLSAFNSASCWQQDLGSFLRKMGGQTPAPIEHTAQLEAIQEPDERKPTKSAPNPLYELSREVILAMIALVAKNLFQTEPFQDHPANNDVLDKLLGGAPAAPKSKSKGKSLNMKLYALPPGIEQAMLGNNGKKDKRKSSTMAPDAADAFEGLAVLGAGAPGSLDGLLDTFTPRLLDFAEEEREASEPDLSDTPAALESDILHRPSALKAASVAQGKGAHPE